MLRNMSILKEKVIKGMVWATISADALSFTITLCCPLRLR